MRYLLMIYADEKAGDKLPAEEMDKWMERMYAYQAALEKAGVFIETAGLARSYEATTVHLENGEMKVHDGPFADTREQLGGFYVIDCPDMAAAQRWAAQCPGAIWGKIEVRPFSHYQPPTER
ncbi:MAG TPA: YciI family protein [Devosiaceae bacterium]|jgi:hypothetical protein|nr:YciI family protein [Devosiaceae bacterium]